MMPRLLYFCCVLVLPLGAQLPPCPGSAATSELSEGMTASKKAEFAKAVEHYEAAVQLAPDCTNARLLLGTGYMALYVPGGETPENLRYADRAREQFDRILSQEPQNDTVMNYIAQIYFNQKQLDDAKVWYEKVIAVNDESKEAFYGLGVIAWTRCYPPHMAARTKLGMKPEDSGPLPDPEVRQSLRTRNLPMVEEGIDRLNRALELDPEYDDAMAYMNLLYREKADIENSDGEYKTDIARADEWVRRALETKQAKARHRR
ncbi:MAG: tetratricopeptide repeat protein [Bryobacteraceae bacterium]